LAMIFGILAWSNRVIRILQIISGILLL